MIRKQRRLVLIGSSVGVLALAAGLILYAMSSSIVFFNSPTDLADGKLAPGTAVRLGGLVKEGSVQRGANLAVRFEVTDGNRAIPVTFVGILPDLFREGQGVVTEGKMQSDGVFKADTVLAKHDENYMPKEVVDALKKQGRWEEGSGKPK
ncbi:MAG: cytochrome c maturation protein CcmE [Alphaproteobacteria bacterium]|nr:cytochrome c maturation protein CcmE [Alphaproteobacteria bacterium]